MVRHVIILIAMLVATSAQAWIDPLLNWNLLCFDFVNQVCVSPTAANTAPEAGTVSLPLTFRCTVLPLNGVKLTYVKIQYKHPSTGVWTDCSPVYSVPEWIIRFDLTMTAFGNDTITTAQYEPGAAMLFRLYATDGLAENASLAADTTAEGTNGWNDEWVVSATAHATIAKPGRPICND